MERRQGGQAPVVSVKRYLAKISWAQIETQEHPNGEFVLHYDYAILLAKYEKAIRLGSDLRLDLSVFHNYSFNREGESPAINRPTIKAWMEAFEPEKIDQ